ncbi:MAG: TolC family protein [Candidatus Hinthialibacter sp.]
MSNRIWHQLIWGMVLTVVLSAATAQEFTPPSPPVVGAAAAEASIEDITVEASILKKEPFRPQGPQMAITLEKAISIALDKNPDMQISRRALRGSLADLDLTESSWRDKFYLNSNLDNTLRRRASGSFRLDPEKGLISDTKREYENDTLFTVGPRYTRTFRNGSQLDIEPQMEYEYYSDGAFDRGVGNPDGNHYEDRYSLNLNYNFPLNSRPREEIRTQLENSRIAAVQSDYNLYSQQEITENFVIVRYWNIKQLQERLQIQRERLLQSRRVAFIIETQYKFENESLQNVGQAQTDVLNNEANMIDLEGQLRNSMENFNIFLGIPIETDLELIDTLEVTPLPMKSEDYVAMVTSTNLDLKTLRLSIRRTENSLQVARLGQQPDLIFSSFAYQTDEGDRNLGAGLIFSWPFGDGGATSARVRALQESLEQSKIRLWDAERQLIQETYSELRELQLQEQRIEILQRNVKQSESTLENGLLNFQEFGRISFRDLQDLQIDAADSRSSLVQAKASYNIAKSNLLSKVHEYSPSQEIEPILEFLE